MNVINATNLRLLAKEIEAAVQEVAAKHGINVKYAGGSYGGQNATLKLAIAVVDSDGTVLTKEATDYDMYANMFGLGGVKFGDTFKTHQGTYRIAGMKPKSHKYPVLAADVATGKMFKFAPSVILRALAK